MHLQNCELLRATKKKETHLQENTVLPLTLTFWTSAHEKLFNVNYVAAKLKVAAFNSFE